MIGMFSWNPTFVSQPNCFHFARMYRTQRQLSWLIVWKECSSKHHQRRSSTWARVYIIMTKNYNKTWSNKETRQALRDSKCTHCVVQACNVCRQNLPCLLTWPWLPSHRYQTPWCSSSVPTCLSWHHLYNLWKLASYEILVVSSFLLSYCVLKVHLIKPYLCHQAAYNFPEKLRDPR